MKMMDPLSDEWTIYEAAHLLNRAGFGGSPVEIEQFHGRGRHGAVEWLLAAKESRPPAKLAWADQEEPAKTPRKNQEELAKLTPAERDEQKRNMVKMLRQERRKQELSLLGWWLNRMRETDAPLQEKMTLFWHDHFPSSTQKVGRPKLMLEQNELFRKEALGNFGRLTQAMTVNPAMMIYLDLAQSNKKNPNENFARELMELFTLGEGHYTEKDVKEAARAFTGYQLNRRTGEVKFAPRKWDEGEKELLGHQGAFDGEAVVELLLAKPECGAYLAGKIWTFFGYENPEPELQAALGEAFSKGGYELRPLLRALFLSEAFYSPRAMRSQIKSPIAFVVMMSRQLELRRWSDGVSLEVLRQLGQLPFMPPNVAGWDWGRAWVNTNTLLTRYHFAGLVTGAGGDPALAGGEQRKKRKGGKGGKGGKGALLRKGLRGSLHPPNLEVLAPRAIRDDIPKLIAELGFRLFQAPLSEKDRTAFESYAKAKKGVIFTDTEVAELMHLMMSTPTYQLT